MSPSSLWQLIKRNEELTTLRLLVEVAGMVATLDDPASTFTMFLPVNSAWDNFLGEVGSTMEQLTENNETLQGLLQYHIYTAAALPSIDILPGMIIPMANLDNLTIASLWNYYTVLTDLAGRTTAVLEWDLEAGTSIGQTTDRVLFPIRPRTVGEALMFNVHFSTFLSLLVATNNTALLNSSTANVTLIVPSDIAFAAALTEMNLTLAGLKKNITLMTTLVGAQIVSSVVTFDKFEEKAGIQYFSTLNPCAKFFSVQSETTGAISLQGSGQLVGQTTTIVEADLFAGRFALIQATDAVLLPLHKWGNSCNVSPWRPSR